MRKVAFIDRDGTLIKEPHDFQVDRLEKIEFCEGVFDGLKKLQSHNYELVMITNQDGLGTDSFPQEDFDLCHNFMMNVFTSQGIEFNEVLICPHLPDENCNCRKPNLGLITHYLHKFDPSTSFVVGDRPSDQQLASNLGISFYDKNLLSWANISDEIFNKHRQAEVQRDTKETKINVQCTLDELGTHNIETGLPFFNHMLEQVAKHSGVSLNIQCQGDLQIDDHHTVEDVALSLGSCLKTALSDKIGITRYGFLLPMDETLVYAAIDLSGRPYSEVIGDFHQPFVGGFSTEMLPHFFKSLSQSLGASIHIKVMRGENTHHQVEACFKSFALCLKQAVLKSGNSLPSTKGVL